MLNKKILELQNIIEYSFDNIEALKVALTHSSYSSQFDKKSSNERMEFLGDSVLSAIVADALYKSYPEFNEGKLSQLKAQIVSTKNLSLWAQGIGLGDYILLGKSDDAKESRSRVGLLCDSFEAIVGSIYLDGGFEKAREFVLKFLDLKKEIVVTDYKSELQKIVQKLYKKVPNYNIAKELGPDHNKRFEINVFVNGKILGNGIGCSKKEAQQSAAKKALKNIDMNVEQKC